VGGVWWFWGGKFKELKGRVPSEQSSELTKKKKLIRTLALEKWRRISSLEAGLVPYFGKISGGAGDGGPITYLEVGV